MLVACEGLVMVLIVGTFWTQIFVPIIRGTKLFPFFRRERALRAVLAGEKQATVEKQIEVQIESEKKERENGDTAGR